jgi:F0F1-type ATP synthase assembly protein I
MTEINKVTKGVFMKNLNPNIKIALILATLAVIATIMTVVVGIMVEDVGALNGIRLFALPLGIAGLLLTLVAKKDIKTPSDQTFYTVSLVMSISVLVFVVLAFLGALAIFLPMLFT